nr:MAG TPA: hypothetical protein [Caudoviricetes sp.]
MKWEQRQLQPKVKQLFIILKLMIDQQILSSPQL